jgi:hypothetical protein
MTATNFHRVNKNTLVASFDLQMPSGMVLVGCTLHEREGRRWVGLPGKAYIDPTGKTCWAKVIGFASSSVSSAFQAAALVAATEAEETANV